MRQGLIGLVLLVGTVAVAWAIVALGQANGAGWIGAVIGPDRMGADAPLVETLFNLLIFVPLIVLGLVAAAAVDRRNALASGTRSVAGLGLGIVVGVAGLSAAVGYAWLAGTLTVAPATARSTGVMLLGLGAIAVQVLGEEIYFRGWLQPALTRRWGWVAGIFAAAIAFAALHVAGGARAPISLVNLFLGGLMFGMFAARNGGLAAAVGAHFAWNAVEQLGYGLDPNPGVSSFGSFVDLELAGAPIWGGSDQGLNGSIGMTIALLAIVVPLALMSWRRLPAPAPTLRAAAQMTATTRA